MDSPARERAAVSAASSREAPDPLDADARDGPDDSQRPAATPARAAADAHRRIQAITVRLGGATTEAEVLHLAIDECAAALGLKNAAVWRREGDELVLAHAAGFSGDFRERFGRVPVATSPLPLAVAARRGTPVWVGSRAEYAHEYPEGEQLSRPPGEPPVAFVCMPLVVAGEARGALALTFDGVHAFDEAEREFFSLLATQCALSLERARLFEAERRARVRVERMQEVIAAFSRARTAEEVAEVACRIGGEAMEAMAGALWLVGDDGALHLAGSWGTPREFMAQFRVIAKDDPGAPAAHVAQVGEPVWVETEADYLRVAPAVYERARAAGRAAAYGAVPLALDGQCAGVIVFSHPLGHRYDAAARGFYVALAQHCAQALDRARLLDAAREAARRAEEASRIKDEFLATVSHELRTPLNAIGGWATLLAQKPDDRAAVLRGLEVIRRNAAAQARIVEDVLDVSRIITGRLKLEPRPVDLCAIVRDALDVVRPSADARRIALSFEPPPEGEGWLVGDPERLQQVVWNLLSNGVKFTEPGGRVDVRVAREAGALVVVTVTDTGCGIAPGFLPHVFERFKQADGSTTRRYGGLGLGLAIVRHIIELHGGRAEVESEGVGRGATFRVTLPAGSSAATTAPDGARDAEARELDAAARAQPRLAGLRVLVVDDEADARELLEAVLGEHGAAVASVASVAEALAMLAPFAPDVLVSDIAMPDADGYALIREVRARGLTLPAIALTAYTRGDERRRALTAGYSAHVPKPLDVPELLAAIANLHALAHGG